MDKNTIIGFVLIAAVLLGFTYFNSKSTEKENERRELTEKVDQRNYKQALSAEKREALDSLPVDQPLQNVADNFFGATQPATSQEPIARAVTKDSSNVASVSAEEKIVSLENEKVEISFSSKGGQMLTAQLKGYKRFDGDSLYLFNKDSQFYLQLRNRHGQVMQTNDLDFTPIVSKDKNSQSLVMRYSQSASQHIDFVYTLSTDDYILKFDIVVAGMEGMLDRESSDLFELNWVQDLRRQEKSKKNEQKYSALYYKYIGDQVVDLSVSDNETRDASEAPTKWVAFKNQYFSSIIIADNKFESTQVTSRILEKEEYLKSYSAKMYAPVELDAKNNTMTAGFSFYLGPLECTKLESYDDGVTAVSEQLDLDKLVPLGWTLFRVVNKYFVIPVFNLLKNTGMSMGIVILLLTIIVKLIISPLTYKSFMSSAKMRVLRPQIEELGAKFPKQDQAMEKQQATMGLYKKAGVNPMSGCIPMLAQMPILIALFQFFPTAIELRQQSFLWAEDLSTYDVIFEWTNTLPLIGNHISLFCVLMTATNIVYTKFNMEMTNTGQQQMPGMKWMMYLMPLIFLFMLNDFPSGLTYYYFLSLLITILLTFAFRFVIDEEKLLAKLEANKAKPKKKSGFMARIEEAQRLQQKQANSKSKKGGKK